MRETKRQRDERFADLGKRGVVFLTSVTPIALNPERDIVMATAAPTPPTPPTPPTDGPKGHVASAQKALDAFAKAAGLPAGSSADALQKMFAACQSAVLAAPPAAAAAAVDDNGTHAQAALRAVGLTADQIAICKEHKIDPLTFLEARNRQRGSR